MAGEARPAGEALIDEMVACEGHGEQPATLVCVHLAESQPDDETIGFHWTAADGDLVANCDACEAEAGDDGFLPEDYVLDNFVVMCRGCFVELAAANGVTSAEIDGAESAARAKSGN